jgi:hypothetical protein
VKTLVADDDERRAVLAALADDMRRMLRLRM